jgi:uncharacterized protein YaaQ
MKMVMAVVSKAEANDVINELVAAGHTATAVESRGGVLRQAYDTLFIAVQEKDLDEVLAIISRSCHFSVSVERVGTQAGAQPVPARGITQVGGAVVFTWDLESFCRY